MDPMYFDDRKKNEPSISMRKALSNIAFVGYMVLGSVLFFGLVGLYGFYRMNQSIEYIKERLDENLFYETIRFKALQPVTGHTMICQVLTNHVCSQISTSFPGDPTDKDRHSADHWVDGKLNIGLQLQRNSANDTNKVGCFEVEDKYEKLKVRDWTTVAFRELGENDTSDKIPRCADKALVLFCQGEFHNCQAVFGDATEVVEITLQP